VRAGDVVLKRSIYRGNVRWAFPHRYVGEWDGRVGIYCGPGNQGKGMSRGPDGYLKRWITDAAPQDLTWERGGVLRFERPGASHSVEVCWDADWHVAGWYVNLQSPTVFDGRRLDTTDWVLDVWVPADTGEPQWKDEDELAEAIELGVFDERSAAKVRAEGERVIAAKPWPTGWEDWRPPAEWKPLELPEDWHVV
jgi:hypothetical protein